MGSSRDFGLALRGKLDGEGKVVYHAMVGNGAGVESDANPGKKLLLSVGFHPSSNVTIELYGDVDNRPKEEGDRYTLQGFFAYHTESFRFGLQYAQQKWQVPQNEVSLSLVSAFAAGRLGSNLRGFARVDRMFEPNPNGAKISYIPFDPTAKATFVVVGLDYAPVPDVHFIPNVEVVSYSAETGSSPSGDVIPRVTFFYRF